MGNSPISVLTLNYSSTFVSPFEYYAMDNWAQLQKIGRIFENNLKEAFPEIQKTIEDQIKKDIKVKMKKEVEIKIQKEVEIKIKEEVKIKIKEEGKLTIEREKEIEKEVRIKINEEVKTKGKLPIEREKEIEKEVQTKINKEAESYFIKQQFYIRKQFDWKIGKLDKQAKKRYSPLYIKQTSAEGLKSYTYAGMNLDNSLMNEAEFFKKWEEQWQETYQNLQEDVKNKITFLHTDMYLCRRFDFECYRAIVQYLYNIRENISILEESLGICSNNTMIPFEQIVQYIRGVNKTQKRVQLVGIYRDFMASYFERIDLPAKLEKTEHYLFEKDDFEIINLQEVNPELLQLIKQQNKYYYFTPGMPEGDTDQCVVLVNKSSKLVPEYFSRHFQEEMDSVQQLKKSINKTLQSQQTFQSKKGSLIKTIKNHFNQKNSKKLIQAFQQVGENQFPKYVPFFKLELNYLIMNPLKAEMEKWVQKYKQQFQKFWLQKKSELKDKDKQLKILSPFLEDIKEHGLLFWSEAFTLVTFKFTNKDLQEDPLNENPIIIGSFHLSSKEVKNRVQIQILGLLIYELNEHGYHFIFGGDFNSYVISSQKNDKEGLFTFVKDFYGGDKEKLEKIKQKIHIYPKHEKIHTTKKKRTILQVQTNKTNLLATKCVDQIISNVPIKLNDCYTGEIKNLNSKQNKNKHFIPNKDHPYDHFAVKAIIDLSQEVHPESK